jgi:hypothetical protein
MWIVHDVALALHVLAAVLAVGPVVAIPLIARFARREGQIGALLPVLMRIVQIGLGVMLLTGVVLDVSVSGAFHRMIWFKAAVALFLVIGVSFGRARTALRRSSLADVERWGWAMCGAVALVTIVMQTKLP